MNNVSKEVSEHFAHFMKQREQVAQDYVTGNSKPLEAISTQLAPASFFGPMGGHVEGVAAVLSTHIAGAAQFEDGSESHLTVLHMGASGDMGYWVGEQHATVHMKGQREPIPMHLRVTELFRLEAGHWKLVHRHADMLSETSAPPKVARKPH